jgi:hypothetical protein
MESKQLVRFKKPVIGADQSNAVGTMLGFEKELSLLRWRSDPATNADMKYIPYDESGKMAGFRYDKNIIPVFLDPQYTLMRLLESPNLRQPRMRNFGLLFYIPVFEGDVKYEADRDHFEKFPMSGTQDPMYVSCVGAICDSAEMEEVYRHTTGGNVEHVHEINFKIRMFISPLDSNDDDDGKMDVDKILNSPTTMSFRCREPFPRGDIRIPANDFINPGPGTTPYAAAVVDVTELNRADGFQTQFESINVQSVEVYPGTTMDQEPAWRPILVSNLMVNLYAEYTAASKSSLEAKIRQPIYNGTEHLEPSEAEARFKAESRLEAEPSLEED